MPENWTKGPWELVTPEEQAFGTSYAVKARTPEGPGWPTPSATGFYQMACPPPHGKDKSDVQKANAHLIAASPDLYEALKEARSILAILIDPESQGVAGISSMTAWAQCVEAEAKARAALKRARGESDHA